jgi:adenine-specific DNA-methyltransferase
MARRAPKPAGPVPVESIKHKDARTNIPTQELRGFVATEEEQPPKVVYPRDPSLDPQLVRHADRASHAHEP